MIKLSQENNISACSPPSLKPNFSASKVQYTSLQLNYKIFFSTLIPKNG